MKYFQADLDTEHKEPEAPKLPGRGLDDGPLTEESGEKTNTHPLRANDALSIGNGVEAINPWSIGWSHLAGHPELMATILDRIKVAFKKGQGVENQLREEGQYLLL